MGSIDRYIFRTTLVSFAVVMGSLTGVIWITQALRGIDNDAMCMSDFELGIAEESEGIIILDDADARPYAAFVRAAKPRCGPLRDRQKNVFDRDADLVSSAAFVPLGADAALGFLVIGSRDADHFHPGKRMDFLAWLGELLAVCLSREQL